MNQKKPMNKAQIAAAAARAAHAPNQGGPAMTPIDPKIIKNGEDMMCMNEIPHPETKEMVICGSPIFVDAYRLKYVSPIMSPTGQQTIGNMMIGKLCVACGKVFNPDEWLAARNKDADDGVKDKRDGKIVGTDGKPI